MICVFAYSPIDQDLANKSSQWLVELGKNPGHRVVIVNDVRCNPNLVRSIEHNLKLVFDTVETTTVNDRVDGWPQAPNIVFRTAAKHIEYTNPEPWLFLEADCVVLKSGWMDALWKEYQQAFSEGRVILGDFVNVQNVEPHCSGIAVYPGNLVDHAPHAVVATDIAWDCFAAHQIVPKMKQTALIAHRWKHPPFNNQSEVDNLLSQIGDTVLFHADKSGTLIDFLRERRGHKVTGNELSLNPPYARSGSTPDAHTYDFFIKTYPHDYPWLTYCLRSIDKFTLGFRDVVVVDSGTTPCPPLAKWQHVDEQGNDSYLWQQVCKMYADTYCDADYICHIDSDTIFTRPVTPQTFFKDGKPIWMYSPLDTVHPNQSHAWRVVMEKFMNKTSEWEFMRRFPFMIPRWAYQAFRDFCKNMHGMELKDYIMSQPYKQFSEFNCMGFFLFEHHYDKFSWVNTIEPKEKWPELTVDQEWSYNEIPKERWEKILSGGIEKRNPTDAPESQSSLFVKAQSASGSNAETRTSKEKVLPAQSLAGGESGDKGAVESLCGAQPPSRSGNSSTVEGVAQVNGDAIEQVKRMFTSPLAKGRIIKKLKAAPILK